MEVDDIQSHHQPCKLSRISNSRNDSNKIGRKGSAADQYQQQQDAEDEEPADQRKVININSAMINTTGGTAGGFDIGSNDNGRLRAWQSSRIFRVSRASGGKDRHSKVLTAKGLRDRRVRLSVSTAIQFYDLQDRLGYDQPSKAVEWLIKAAADAITELPSLSATFPDAPKQLLCDDKRTTHHNVNLEPRLDIAEMEFNTDSAYNQHHQQQQQNLSLSKSACSSTSETSKGSVLSLSRSEIRVKARERARERTAKDKEKEKPDEAPHHTSSTGRRQQNAQSSSFTELLTGAQHNNSSSLSAAQQNLGFSDFVISKQHRPLAPTQMDYFSGGLFGGGTLRNNNHYSSSGFSTQNDYGNASQATPHTMGVPPPPFTVTADHHHHQNQQHPEMHQFSFLSDHLIPDTAAATAANGNEYNLNFTISSGIAGFNRGTLQSNSSQSQLPHHLQPRFSSSPSDGPNMPFFMGNVGNAASSLTPAGNQFPSGFDGRLQLCYGDGGGSHSEMKGKGKN